MRPALAIGSVARLQRRLQWLCFPPAQWQPREPGFFIPHAGAAPASEAAEEANTDKRFDNFVDPQCGHLVPFHVLDRTSSSLSFSHFSQWNS
jgi:hypothetical protein